MLENNPRLGVVTAEVFPGPVVAAGGPTDAQADISVAPTVRTMRSRICLSAKFIVMDPWLAHRTRSNRPARMPDPAPKMRMHRLRSRTRRQSEAQRRKLTAHVRIIQQIAESPHRGTLES